jgi:hypothetical protein
VLTGGAEGDESDREASGGVTNLIVGQGLDENTNLLIGGVGGNG